MRTSKRALMVVLVAATTALLTGLAAGAFGAEGKEHHGNSPHSGKRQGVPLIEESLAPSQTTDPTFHGVKPVAQRRNKEMRVLYIEVVGHMVVLGCGRLLARAAAKRR